MRHRGAACDALRPTPRFGWRVLTLAFLLFSASHWFPATAHITPPTDITATPNTGLTDLQAVAVSGNGFSVNSSVNIDECAADESSCLTLANPTTNSSGAFAGTINVRRTFVGDNGSVNCATTGCILHVYDAITGLKHATDPITFAPTGGGGGGTGPPIPSGLTCAGLRPTIAGTDGSEQIVGTAGNDVIAALGGDDTVLGVGGNDIVCGGAGNDVLKGGGGNDKVLGEAGRDKLRGGPGRDTCKGGPQPDTAKKCEKVRSL